MEIWKKGQFGELYDRWPKNENGEPEEAVLLQRCRSNDLEPELRKNMLEAYGIPCVFSYPGDGEFGKVVLGMSGNGVDILVPKSLLEDAVELCKEDNIDEL